MHSGTLPLSHTPQAQVIVLKLSDWHFSFSPLHLSLLPSSFSLSLLPSLFLSSVPSFSPPPSSLSHTSQGLPVLLRLLTEKAQEWGYDQLHRIHRPFPYTFQLKEQTEEREKLKYHGGPQPQSGVRGLGHLLMVLPPWPALLLIWTRTVPFLQPLGLVPQPLQASSVKILE